VDKRRLHIALSRFVGKLASTRSAASESSGAAFCKGFHHAALDFNKQRESLRDQIDALAYRAGRDRDNFMLGRDLERNPNLDPSQRDALYDDSQVLAARKSMEETAQATREMFHSAVGDGVSEGFANGARSGLAKLGDTLRASLQKRFEDFATRGINALLDKGLGGLGQTYGRGGASHTPPFVAPPALRSRSEGSGLGDVIKGALGGDGTNTMTAQTVIVRGNVVNVSGGAGAMVGSGAGSRPSTEQALGGILSFLG
jgi:hypothetical protein